MRISLALLLVSGCEIEPCDPGQEHQNGLCFPQMAPPNSGGASNGGASNGLSGAGGAEDCSPSSEFGDACATTAECLCPTNYCALPPGQAMGMCTHTGCLEDPSVCPSDFQCQDLSVFDPSLPSICVPPS
jgi:hypothetical protein